GERQHLGGIAPSGLLLLLRRGALIGGVVVVLLLVVDLLVVLLLVRRRGCAPIRRGHRMGIGLVGREQVGVDVGVELGVVVHGTDHHGAVVVDDGRQPAGDS